MVAALLCLACVAPNSEALLVRTDRPAPVRKIIRQAGRRPYKVPMPTTVNPRFGQFTDPKGGELGPTGGYTNSETGEVFMPEYDPFGYAHELFHLLDAQALTDQDRARFQKILKLKGPWDQGTGTSGLGSPSEIVADYYAGAALGLDLNRENVSAYAQMTPRRLRRMGRSFERMLARRPDLRPYENPVAKGVDRG